MQNDHQEMTKRCTKKLKHDSNKMQNNQKKTLKKHTYTHKIPTTRGTKKTPDIKQLQGEGAFTYFGPEVHCSLLCLCLEESGNIQSMMYNRALSGSRGSTCQKEELLLGSAPPVITMQTTSKRVGGGDQNSYLKTVPPVDAICVFVEPGRSLASHLQSWKWHAHVNLCVHCRLGI